VPFIARISVTGKWDSDAWFMGTDNTAIDIYTVQGRGSHTVFRATQTFREFSRTLKDEFQ